MCQFNLSTHWADKLASEYLIFMNCHISTMWVIFNKDKFNYLDGKGYTTMAEIS